LPFTHQEWLRQESEQRIINALSDGDKGFGDLLVLADLSKPILSERLKDLTRRGKVDVVPHKATKRFLYSLKKESLEQSEWINLFFHKLSKAIVERLEEAANDPSTSEQEYMKMLEKEIMALMNFKLTTILMAPHDAKKEWLRTAFGSEFANKFTSILPRERVKKLEKVIIQEDPEEALLLKEGSPEEKEKDIIDYIAKKLEKLEEKQSKAQQ